MRKTSKSDFDKGMNIYLSSRVLSNHCTPAVMSAFWWRTIRWRDRLQTRSERMGLRLYAMAEEPI
jgi:hypothetical protein